MYYHWIKVIGGHIPACFLIHMIWNFNLMEPSAILNLLWWKVPKVYHPLCKAVLNISNWFQSPGVCIVGTGGPWICILLTITCMICLVMPSLSLLCSKLSSQNFLIFFFFPAYLLYAWDYFHVFSYLLHLSWDAETRTAQTQSVTVWQSDSIFVFPGLSIFCFLWWGYRI